MGPALGARAAVLIVATRGAYGECGFGALAADSQASLAQTPTRVRFSVILAR